METLRCSRCHAVKPLDGFARNRETARGYQYQCKDCNRTSRQRTGAAREAQLRYARDRNLRTKYRITLETYEEMVASVESRCDLCHQVRPLVVDHDHSCCPGKRSCGRCLRGLLCAACNHALGQFQDDPERMRWAADYVERSKMARDRWTLDENGLRKSVYDDA